MMYKTICLTALQTIDLDPYSEPCAKEEMAQYGEKYDSQNRAKNYVNQLEKGKEKKKETTQTNLV